jgi:ankyrin repeat protein
MLYCAVYNKIKMKLLELRRCMNSIKHGIRFFYLLPALLGMVSLRGMEEGPAKKACTFTPPTEIQNELDKLLVNVCEPVSTADKAMHQLVFAQQLLKMGANPNASESGGEFVLHRAITFNNISLTKLLLAYGANINVASSNGITPLHAAASSGLKDAAKILLEHGADVNATPNNAPPPLFFASMFGGLDIVKFLLGQGAYMTSKAVTESQLFEQLVHKNLHQIGKELIRTGILVTLQDEEEMTAVVTLFKDHPLILAAVLGNKGEIENLIAKEEHAAELNEACIYAVAQGRKEIVLYLLGKGASPLHEAIPLVDLILKRGSVAEHDRETYECIKRQLICRLPLFEQILYRDTLKNKLAADSALAPTEIAVKINPTLILIKALEKACVEEVSLALQAGANPNGQNQDSVPLLAYAAFHDNFQESEKIVAYLLTYGANPTQFLIKALCTAHDAQQRKTIIAMIVKAAQEKYGFLADDVLDAYNALFISRENV